MIIAYSKWWVKWEEKNISMIHLIEHEHCHILAFFLVQNPDLCIYISFCKKLSKKSNHSNMIMLIESGMFNSFTFYACPKPLHCNPSGSVMVSVWVKYLVNPRSGSYNCVLWACWLSLVNFLLILEHFLIARLFRWYLFLMWTSAINTFIQVQYVYNATLRICRVLNKMKVKVV